MIVRLVKLRFRESEIPAFLANFEKVKEKIRASNGCLYLELLRGEDDPCNFFTHSHWVSDKALQDYRNSELFKGIWADTKTKFSAKPEAWTTSSLEKLL